MALTYSIGGSDGIVSSKAGDATLSGTAIPGAGVALEFDGLAPIMVMANASGNWSYSLTASDIAAIGQGNRQVGLKETVTLSGNTSVLNSAKANFTVDTVPPAVTIDSAGPLDNTVLLVGTSEPNSTVLIYDGATLRGTTFADGSGNWAHTILGVSDGTHSLTATATDLAGNTSPPTAPRTVTVDTTPPAAVTIANTAPYDNNGALILSGTAEASSMVQVYDGAALLGTASANVSGTWSFAVSGLSEATHTFTAKAIDGAGNVGLVSAAYTVTVDRTKLGTPAIASVAPVKEDTMLPVGIAIGRGPDGGPDVSHFRITGITGGILFYLDGQGNPVAIAEGAFIPAATSKLYFIPAPDFAGTASFSVQPSLSATAAGLGGTAAAGKIIVENVPDAPTGVVIASGGTVSENAAAGSVVATLSGIDPDGPAGLTFAMADPSGAFRIDGNRILVASPLALDFEAGQGRKVVVTVSDGTASKSVELALTVADVVGETVVGDAAANVIRGGVGRDTLSGAGGSDTLSGGVDRDTLKGGAGNDTLLGGAGNDLLFGGTGRDTLTGGKGKDAFVFDSKAARSSVDRITDFSVRDDSLYLDNAVFKALGKGGTVAKPVKLDPAFLAIGPKAQDANDHLIYDPKTGVLFYDADGTGGAAQVQVATLSKGLKLTPADFFVI